MNSRNFLIYMYGNRCTTLRFVLHFRSLHLNFVSGFQIFYIYQTIKNDYRFVHFRISTHTGFSLKLFFSLKWSKEKVK